MGGGGKGGGGASENPYSRVQADIATQLWGAGDPFRNVFQEDYAKFLGLEKVKSGTSVASSLPDSAASRLFNLGGDKPISESGGGGEKYVRTGQGGELPSYLINPSLEESAAYARRSKTSLLESGATGGNLTSEIAAIERNRSNTDVAIGDSARKMMRQEALQLAYGQTPGISSMLGGASNSWAQADAADAAAGAAGWQTAAGLAGTAALAYALKPATGGASAVGMWV